VSAAVAVVLSIVAVVGWRAMWPGVSSGAGRLFVHLAAAVIWLVVLHHVAIIGAVLWGHRPQVTVAIDAALVVVGGASAYLTTRHGALLRHIADAPGLLRFAMARVAVAEAAVDDIRECDLADMRTAVSGASRRVVRIESRVVRDADATALIERLVASMSTASIIVGADGALVVVTGSDAFWRLSAIPPRRGVRLIDALCLESSEATALLALFEREGARVSVRATARNGAVRRIELETVYLPAERGGRMWIVCRPAM
jgi:hypothetical protein